MSIVGQKFGKMPLINKIFGGIMAAESRERHRQQYSAKVKLRQAGECKKKYSCLLDLIPFQYFIIYDTFEERMTCTTGPTGPVVSLNEGPSLTVYITRK